MLEHPQVYQLSHNATNEGLAGLAAHAAAAKAAAEVDLVRAVLAEPSRLLPVAEAEGVGAGHFTEQDLRLIWCACGLARDRPLSDVLVLARAALQDAGYWCPDGPISFAPRWSNETLVRLALSYPFSPSLVRSCARRVRLLAARWSEAERLCETAEEVLAGFIDRGAA